MGGTDDDLKFMAGRVPGRSYMSKVFVDPIGSRARRFFHRVFDQSCEVEAVRISGEDVVRTTRGGRVQVRALVLEDSREIDHIVLMKSDTKSGKPHKTQISLQKSDVPALLKFLAAVAYVDRGGDEGSYVEDKDLVQLLTNPSLKRRFFSQDVELAKQVAMEESSAADFVAVGYRRRQLGEFRRYLDDESYFTTCVSACGGSAERVWQRFFERNPWIFGYGLQYRFMTPLDSYGGKLELPVAGPSIDGVGKRTDAVMKTRGAISAMCFVEIKHHRTELLHQVTKPHRSGTWAVSQELTGGIIQVQQTLDRAMETGRREWMGRSKNGDPTGESVFRVQPKAILVIGRLDEFVTEYGVNQEKSSSFEHFRAQVRSPEIVTFDELYERARFICTAHV